MASSKAETVEQYISELPVETMSWGMIAYEIPLEVFPDTNNNKPLLYAALASQKNHMAVYLHSIYLTDGDAEWFKQKYIETGKKLDMGSSCVRFKKLEQLPVELVGEAIAKVSVDDFIEHYKAN